MGAWRRAAAFAGGGGREGGGGAAEGRQLAAGGGGLNRACAYVLRFSFFAAGKSILFRISL